MDEIKIFTTPILDSIRIREYKGIVIVRNVGAKNKSLLMASAKGTAVVIE